MTNLCIIAGYLGQDPEVINTQNGQRIARLRICTTERGYITHRGETIPDRHTWHNASLYGNLVNYAPNLHKGDFVSLRGRYHTREVADENTGEVRTYYNLDVDEIFDTFGKTQNNPQQ